MQSFNITTQRREFKITPKGEMKNNPNAAEFETELNKIIAMATLTGVGAGMVGGFEVLGEPYHFEEITTDASRQQNETLAKVNQFLDLVYQHSNGYYNESANEVQSYLLKIRADEISVEEAAAKMKEHFNSLHGALRRDEQNCLYTTAEVWANKPGLTKEEACHGVAYDAYRLKLATLDKPTYIYTNLDEGMAEAEYKNNYTEKKAPSIQAKLVRCAKDLFD